MHTYRGGYLKDKIKIDRRKTIGKIATVRFCSLENSSMKKVKHNAVMIYNFELCLCTMIWIVYIYNNYNQIRAKTLGRGRSLSGLKVKKKKWGKNDYKKSICG